MTHEAPLEISVTVASELRAIATHDVEARIESHLRALFGGLSVRREPTVSVSPRNDALAIDVDGRPCAVPETAVARASAYVRGSPLVARGQEGTLLGIDDAQLAAEALALVCEAALIAEPGLWTTGAEQHALLDLGIALPPPDAPPPGPRDDPSWLESMIAEHTPEAISIFIDPGYLRTLTIDTPRDDGFPFLRDGMFAELGILLPDFRLRLDPALRPGGFAFGFGQLRTMPCIGLEPGTMLVNDTPARLEYLDVDAKSCANPATDTSFSVTSIEHKSVIADAGLSTWDPFEYLILTLAAEVRRHARRLVTNTLTSRLVNPQLVLFSTLAEHIRALVPEHVVTRVLRDLAEDRISIRNVRRIFELLLRYETDDDLQQRGDRISFVRSGLGDAIAYGVARSSGPIIAYLLSPGLERAFRVSADSVKERTGDDAAIVDLRTALAKELRDIPGTAAAPAVLTDERCRAAVRAALRPQFPDISVVSYHDIPPTVNIQAVGRLGVW